MIDRPSPEGINKTEKIEARINSIHQLIDPEKTLPAINLEISSDNMATLGTLTHTKYDLKHNGQLIGKMSINTDKINHKSWIYPINIDEQFQGKGFGMSAHIAAIDKSLREGHSLTTHDWSHTQGSKHIWDILADKGVAKIIEPFQADDNEKYVGDFIVESL